MSQKASDNELFEQLKAASVVSDGHVYRMRLFTPNERRILRRALTKKLVGKDGKIHESGWECVEDGAGMMDELEMVNFQSGGKDEIRRQI